MSEFTQALKQQVYALVKHATINVLGFHSTNDRNDAQAQKQWVQDETGINASTIVMIIGTGDYAEEPDTITVITSTTYRRDGIGKLHAIK